MNKAYLLSALIRILAISLHVSDDITVRVHGEFLPTYRSLGDTAAILKLWYSAAPRLWWHPGCCASVVVTHRLCLGFGDTLPSPWLWGIWEFFGVTATASNSISIPSKLAGYLTGDMPLSALMLIKQLKAVRVRCVILMWFQNLDCSTVVLMRRPEFSVASGIIKNKLHFMKPGR